MQQHNLVPFIGITGGIGSGKSIICRIFSCLGIPVFDSDKEAKKIIAEDPIVKKQIIQLVGKKAYDEHGIYQTNYIRHKIIENPEVRQGLNAIVHPAVRLKAIEFQSLLVAKIPFALYESALLNQQNKPDFITKIISITCDKETRIERLIHRNLNREEAMKIIDLQEKNYPQTNASDFTINNQKNEKVLPQVMSIFEKLIKNCSLIVLFTLLSISSFGQINCMTFNIRLDTKDDGINQWPFRKERCAELVKYHQVDILGMQEAFVHQIKDMEKQLPDYKWFGRGRDDGKEAGEFSPLMYNSKKIRLLDQATFWLSDSCEKVGFGWDAACRRVVTWGKFKELKSNKTFFVFNTHFDHLGKIARRESAKLVLKKIQEIGKNYPIILMGDFNATPNEEPIQLLVDINNPNKVTDTEKISKNGHYGPYSTFNGFKQEQKDRHIDYIFVKNGPKVLQHTTHSETWNNLYPSDHFPVSSLIQLP
ncbi:MAG: hypothetical protein RI995_1889 [Bacteroidota bacterium]|jgi:dephospho-CoA kinase